ncbi:hypothetical protein P154DRAFT_394328, partial [Amniculicola lignicola CBS 123094]
MGDNWKYYDVENYNSWKKNQGRNFKSPPRANFLAAANHLRSLFDGKKINWAAIGGLSMLCLGSDRDMPDIHIVYDDKDFHRVQSKLEHDSRVRLPQGGMNPLFSAKILVGTGPRYKDHGCADNADVEVDLLPPGKKPLI